MTKEEIEKVFYWLEENANKNDLLYFKLLDNNQIGAYYKTTNRHFADFYINVIKEILKKEDDSNK